MKTHELAVVAFAAMLGGAIANVGLAQIKPVAAQDAPKDAISDIVRTKRFELVDSDKKTRISMDVLKDGPFIGLKDKEGNSRLSVQVFPTGEAILSLKGTDGKTRLSLITDTDGTPTIALSDAKGNTRGTLATAKDGEPRFAILDEKGKAGALLRLKGLAPQLEMYDHGGTVRAALGAQENDITRLILNDKEGNLRLALGDLADGAPLMAMYHKDGGLKGLFHVDADGKPQLSVAGAKGKAGAALALEASGTLGWTITDEAGNQRVLLSLDAQYGPVIQFRDAALAEIFKAPR